jgi:hypothetical protein
MDTMKHAGRAAGEVHDTMDVAHDWIEAGKFVGRFHPKAGHRRGVQSVDDHCH